MEGKSSVFNFKKNFIHIIAEWSCVVQLHFVMNLNILDASFFNANDFF